MKRSKYLNNRSKASIIKQLKEARKSRTTSLLEMYKGMVNNTYGGYTLLRVVDPKIKNNRTVYNRGLFRCVHCGISKKLRIAQVLRTLPYGCRTCSNKTKAIKK